MNLTDAEDLLARLGVVSDHLEQREALPHHSTGWTLEQHEGYVARQCRCGAIYIVARSRLRDTTDCGACRASR